MSRENYVKDADAARRLAVGAGFAVAELANVAAVAGSGLGMLAKVIKNPEIALRVDRVGTRVGGLHAATTTRYHRPARHAFVNARTPVTSPAQPGHLVVASSRPDKVGAKPAGPQNKPA